MERIISLNLKDQTAKQLFSKLLTEKVKSCIPDILDEEITSIQDFVFALFGNGGEKKVSEVATDLELNLESFALPVSEWLADIAVVYQKTGKFPTSTATAPKVVEKKQQSVPIKSVPVEEKPKIEAKPKLLANALTNAVKSTMEAQKRPVQDTQLSKPEKMVVETPKVSKVISEPLPSKELNLNPSDEEQRLRRLKRKEKFGISTKEEPAKQTKKESSPNGDRKANNNKINNSQKETNSQQKDRVENFVVRVDSKKKKVEKVHADRSQPPPLEDEEGKEEESPIQEQKKQKKSQKCSFFPNCTKGEDCPFVHPTEMCKNFPKCTFGDSCLYIHPKVECKFGLGCTRPGCAYTHPEGFVAPTLPFGGMGMGMGMSIPIQMQMQMMMAHKQQQPIVDPSTACKNGYVCPRVGCTMVHPLEACKFGTSCMKVPCIYSHSSPCKFGVKCNKVGCIFAHAKISGQTSCKYGANCPTKATCKFQHPITTEELSSISDSLPKTPPQMKVAESGPNAVAVQH